MSVEARGRPGGDDKEYSLKPAPSPLGRASTSSRDFSSCGSQDETLNSSRCFSPLEADLVREIAAIELEISQLEQHLLSLYRAAFADYICSGSAGHVRGSPPPGPGDLRHEQKAEQLKSDRDGREGQSSLLGTSKPISPHRRAAAAHHLGSPISSWDSEAPCKLSEDIIRCMTSVYAELADPPVRGTDSSASPASSSYSTSGHLGLPDGVDSWSTEPPFRSTPRRSQSRKNSQGPYAGMLEISKISADGSRFASAASMIQNYSSLIRRLEATDPRELTREEKLAFWINVHNALVMHAFLAYGLRRSSTRSAGFSKAAYDVGGLTVNAREIRSSILGCQSHRPEPKLRALFPTRSQKSTRVTAKHPYAVDQPEPLVHFALCGGAHSDPAVRVYSAVNVRRELEAARDEFLQSNVFVAREKRRMILPKLLVHYAADAGMDPQAVLEMARAAIPVESCSVDYSPCKSNFRYIIHGDLIR